MPRTTAAVAAETARRVRAHATELFAHEGYAAVSLDAVARAAGVTRGAIYHHFADKAGLFAAVTAELQQGVAAAVVDAAQEAPDAQGRLRAGSHAFVDAITAESVRRILLVDAPAVIGWDAWRRLDAEGSARHLHEALADAGIATADLAATTAQLSGAMNEAALWIAAGGDPAAAHRVLDRLLDAVLD